MKRANKVVLAQPAAAAPPLLPRAPGPGPARGGAGGVGEASRARLRHRSLLQDYKELLKETEAKKNKLHLEKMKKQRLLAEVMFLRKRYKSMSENPSQTVVYRVKNPAMADERHRSTVHAVGSSSKGPPEHLRRQQHSALRASPVIDLNEACELSSEETEEFDGYQDSVSAKSNYYTLEGDDDAAAGPSDAKMASAFWDVRNPAARAGKRKISWQDQLALRV